MRPLPVRRRVFLFYACFVGITLTQDLIETVISTIQEPEVTEAGVAAVMAKLHAYSAGINRLVDSLPPNTANGADGHLGLGGIGV